MQTIGCGSRPGTRITRGRFIKNSKMRLQVLGINMLLYVAMDRLAYAERHHTVAGREAAEALGVFTAEFVNTFLASLP
jgi:hypothetical protein